MFETAIFRDRIGGHVMLSHGDFFPCCLKDSMSGNEESQRKPSSDTFVVVPDSNSWCRTVRFFFQGHTGEE